MPKPLLEVAGKPLIVWHLERLARAGVDRIVINTSWLAHCFVDLLGRDFQGLPLTYSMEGAWPLDTAGGIVAALPALGEHDVLCVNGDIWSDGEVFKAPRPPDGDAHLLLRPLPAFRRAGQFESLASARLGPGQPAHTFAGYAYYRAPWLQQLPNERGSLLPHWINGLRAGRISVSALSGRWEDVGTPERLAALNASLAH